MKTKASPHNPKPSGNPGKVADTNQIGFAALSLQETENGWCQLLPAGHFSAIDGRPEDVEGGQWLLDEETANVLIADLKSKANPVVIDYEHQTLLSEKNGQPAPASGWIKDIEWRDSGLWIQPDWTQRARDFISNGEYAYLSAVFPYDRKTGKPRSLHSAALVNRPGLDGLNGVALRELHFPAQPNPTQEEPVMLKAIAKALGLAEDAKEDQIITAINGLKKGKSDADEKVASLKAEIDSGTDIDLSKYAPVEVVTEMQKQLAALSAQVETGTVDSLIQDALDEGRILPVHEQWMRDLGNKDVAALKEYLNNAPPVAALKGMQAGDEKPPAKKPTNEGLTDDELEAARLTGRTPEEFAALKATS